MGECDDEGAAWLDMTIPARDRRVRVHGCDICTYTESADQQVILRQLEQARGPRRGHFNLRAPQADYDSSPSGARGRLIGPYRCQNEVIESIIREMVSWAFEQGWRGWE